MIRKFGPLSIEVRRRRSADDLESCLKFLHGMLSEEEGTRLYELARDVASGCIVEVGSFRGRSTVCLAMGSRDGAGVPVYAIEPHEPFEGVLGGEFGPEDRGAFYRAMLETGCYRHVRLVNLSSEIVAPGWTLPVGLLWIDGDHSYEGVVRDFRCWEPHLVQGTVIAFDDALDPSIGPRRFIDELVAEGAYEEREQIGKVTVIGPTVARD